MVAEVAVLVNPAAGRGSAARLVEPVVERLRTAGVKARPEAGRDAAEAAELARHWVDQGVDAIVVIGGDGMVHLALQAVAGAETTLGVVPAGTGNDLARALGIPRADPLAATDLVIADQRRTIDLGRAGGQWFSTVLCAGIDARIAERVNRMRLLRGRRRYDVATLAEVRDFATRSFLLHLDEGEEQQVEGLLVAVGNTASYGGGLRMCAGADPTDGSFQVVVVGAATRRDLVRLYPRLTQGGHIGHPLVQVHRAQRVSVAAPETTAYADGERMGALPITVESVPAALRIFAPPRAEPAS